MANFRKESKNSKEGVRLYVAAAFPQKAPMTGYNMAIGVANDLGPRKGQNLQSAPMLAYDNYTTKDGKEGTSYTRPYSKEQYNAIMAIANTKGDCPVFKADVFPKNNGMVVNTSTLAKTSKPFDKAEHQKNTELARAEVAKQREAQQAQAQNEAEAQEEVAASVEQEGPEVG